MAIEYGRCPCSGHYANRWVEVKIPSDAGPIVLEDTPQGACPLCGSRVYKRYVLEQVEGVLVRARARDAASE